MKKYVYSFGGGTADGDGKMKDMLGGKGAGLAEMAAPGVPVPPGFTISTEVCNLFFENGNKVPEGDGRADSTRPWHKLEAQMGKKLGDADDPLLLSVRSGAKFSMPGMMNTILNLGLNDKTTEGLARKTGNPRFAYDCYRRFIQMFGEVALHIDMEKFDHIFDARKDEGQGQARHRSDSRRSEGDHRRLQEAGQEGNRQAIPAGRARAAYACRAMRCSIRGIRRRRSTTGGWKRFRMPSALRRTCRPWCSATWARLRVPASASRAIRHRRERVLRRIPCERAGRRRGGRHPHAAADRRTRTR